MSTPDLPEINKVADELIQSIKRYHKTINGKSLVAKEILKEATEAISRRLK